MKMINQVILLRHMVYMYDIEFGTGQIKCLWCWCFIQSGHESIKQHYLFDCVYFDGCFILSKLVC